MILPTYKGWHQLDYSICTSILHGPPSTLWNMDQSKDEAGISTRTLPNLDTDIPLNSLPRCATGLSIEERSICSVSHWRPFGEGVMSPSEYEAPLPANNSPLIAPHQAVYYQNTWCICLAVLISVQVLFPAVVALSCLWRQLEFYFPRFMAAEDSIGFQSIITLDLSWFYSTHPWLQIPMQAPSSFLRLFKGAMGMACFASHCFFWTVFCRAE